jgi:hypothetical protein
MRASLFIALVGTTFAAAGPVNHDQKPLSTHASRPSNGTEKRPQEKDGKNLFPDTDVTHDTSTDIHDNPIIVIVNSTDTNFMGFGNGTRLIAYHGSLVSKRLRRGDPEDDNPAGHLPPHPSKKNRCGGPEEGNPAGDFPDPSSQTPRCGNPEGDYFAGLLPSLSSKKSCRGDPEGDNPASLCLLCHLAR